MDSTALQNAILRAADAVVANRVSNLKTDITVTVQIKKCVNALTGEYRVIYNGGTITAYAYNDMTYTTGQEVYMLVPQGDFTNKKMLTGVAQSSSDDANISFVSSAISGYNLLGKNILQDDNGIYGVNGTSIGLHSYLNSETRVLYYHDEQDDTMLTIDTQEMENNLKEAEGVLLRASFRTRLPNEHKTAQSGVYGLLFTLAFADRDNVDDEGNAATKYYSYAIDTNTMTGNPFRFTSWSEQHQIFSIDLDNFLYVDSIIFWEHDFEDEDNEQLASDIFGWGADIFVKDIEFYGLKHITATQDGYTLSVSTPKGSTFRSILSTDTLEAVGTVTYENLNLSDDTTFYWFKEDGRVDANGDYSDYYQAYGGAGWYYLKDKGSTYDILLSASDNKAYENRYKVVATYQSSIILKEEFVLYNEACKRDIAIESDIGVKFSFDRGIHLDENGNEIPGPKLTCLINGYSSNFERDESNPHADSLYTFIWSKESSTEGTTIFTQTRDEVLEEIANMKANPPSTYAESAEISRYTSTLMSLQNTATSLVDVSWSNNVLIYPVRAIDTNATFKCTVYVRDTKDSDDYCIGSATIILQNEDSAQPTDYYITIENGNQVFQYSESGVSPDDDRYKDPQEVLPLICHFYDPAGIEVNANTYSVKWKVPLESTMIVTPSEMAINPLNNLAEWNLSTEYPLEIADNYDYFALNNQIHAIVTYGDEEFTQQSSLTFTKVGENGTNGTDVVAKISLQPTVVMADNSNMLALTLRTDSAGKRLQSNFYWNDKDLSPVSTNLLRLQLFQRNTELALTNKTISWNMAGGGYGSSNRNSKYLNVSDGTLTYDDTNSAGAYFRNQIVEASVSYDGTDYYAYYQIPIIDYRSSSGYRIDIDYDETLKSVLYNADGFNPIYNKNQGVKLKLTDSSGHEVNKYVVWYAVGGSPASKNDDMPAYPDFKLIRERSRDRDSATLENEGIYLTPLQKTETVKVTYAEGDDIPVNKQVGDVVKDSNGNDVIKTTYVVDSKGNPVYENLYTVYILPNDEYTGQYCNNIAIAKIYTNKNIYDNNGNPEAIVYMPILMTLNTYGLKSLNAWDGTHLEINQDENYILAPQIGAGEKDSANRFTGVVMGKASFYDQLDSTSSKYDTYLTGNLESFTSIGLLGYSHGKQSIWLDAETGNATFGLQEDNNAQGDNWSSADTSNVSRYNEGRIRLEPGGTSYIGNWKIGSRQLYNITSGVNTPDHSNLTTPYADLPSSEYKISIPHDAEGVLLSAKPAYISIKSRKYENTTSSTEPDYDDPNVIVQPDDSFEIQLDPNQKSVFTIYRHTAKYPVDATVTYTISRSGNYVYLRRNGTEVSRGVISNNIVTWNHFSTAVTSYGSTKGYAIARPLTGTTLSNLLSNFFVELVSTPQSYVVPEMVTGIQKTEAYHKIYNNLIWRRDKIVGINNQGRFYANSLRDSSTSVDLGAIGAFGSPASDGIYTGVSYGLGSSDDIDTLTPMVKFFVSSAAVTNKNVKTTPLYITSGTSTTNEYSRSLNMNFNSLNFYADGTSKSATSGHKITISSSEIYAGHSNSAGHPIAYLNLANGGASTLYSTGAMTLNSSGSNISETASGLILLQSNTSNININATNDYVQIVGGSKGYDNNAGSNTRSGNAPSVRLKNTSGNSTVQLFNNYIDIVGGGNTAGLKINGNSGQQSRLWGNSLNLDATNGGINVYSHGANIVISRMLSDGTNPSATQSATLTLGYDGTNQKGTYNLYSSFGSILSSSNIRSGQTGVSISSGLSVQHGIYVPGALYSSENDAIIADGNLYALGGCIVKARDFVFNDGPHTFNYSGGSYASEHIDQHLRKLYELVKAAKEAADAAQSTADDALNWAKKHKHDFSFSVDDYATGVSVSGGGASAGSTANCVTSVKGVDGYTGSTNDHTHTYYFYEIGKTANVITSITSHEASGSLETGRKSFSGTTDGPILR